MPAHFENGQNMTNRPPVHMKKGHFLSADFENGRVWKLNSNRQMLETASCEPSKMTKPKHFDAFGARLIDTKGAGTFLWHQSLATSFLPSNLLPFSNCSGIM